MTYEGAIEAAWPRVVGEGLGLVRTDAGLKSMLDALGERDPDVARVLARIGHPVARARDPGFATLLRVITAQQISTVAANAIWGRLARLLGEPIEPAAYLRATGEQLRAVGLSARKASYGHALATAFVEARLDAAALAEMEDEAAITAITALPGLGRWSAEIYLLFALGRADAFPADDIALQAGYQRLKRLESRPKGKALRTLVEPWAPYRGAGAVLLWHVYGAATLDD